jgi:hypothetical protein
MNDNKSKDLPLVQKLISCLIGKERIVYTMQEISFWSGIVDECPSDMVEKVITQQNLFNLLHGLDSSYTALWKQILLKGVLLLTWHVFPLSAEKQSELQGSCPSEVKDQYDFCMICSETDVCEAGKLTENLNDKYKLTRHLVWNSVYLGADQYAVFEEVFQRNSVVIFYITKNFIEDKFCCHIAITRLVSPVEISGTIRGIPLLIDGDVTLPESLQLVQTLTLQYIGTHFPKISPLRFDLKKLKDRFSVKC